MNRTFSTKKLYTVHLDTEYKGLRYSSSVMIHDNKVSDELAKKILKSIYSTYYYMYPVSDTDSELQNFIEENIDQFDQRQRYSIFDTDDDYLILYSYRMK